LIFFESYIRAITLNQLEKVQLGLSATANLPAHLHSLAHHHSTAKRGGLTGTGLHHFLTALSKRTI
jgi:hypothetical protein